MWVPKAECPKCHTQQSFDEYNRGIARCQLCEVRYFHKFEIDEFIPYTKQFHEKFALFDPLRSFKLSPLHFSSVLFDYSPSLTFALLGSLRCTRHRWSSSWRSSSFERCITGTPHHSSTSRRHLPPQLCGQFLALPWMRRTSQQKHAHSGTQFFFNKWSHSFITYQFSRRFKSNFCRRWRPRSSAPNRL